MVPQISQSYFSILFSHCPLREMGPGYLEASLLLCTLKSGRLQKTVQTFLFWAYVLYVTDASNNVQVIPNNCLMQPAE